jgi:NAD(P)H-dependent FMN reductase
MKMSPATKNMIDSYVRNLIGTLVSAFAIVGGGASPLSFSSSQWAEVANALWAALIPTVLRYVNKKDPAFGRIAEPILEDAQKATVKAIKKTAKKAPAKN